MTVTESVSDVTSVDDVLVRVRELVPFLRANAADTESARRVPDASIDALTAAGVWRLYLPKSRGGFEASTAVQNEVFAEIARGCPSTGWVATLISCSNWMISIYPDQAQEEVYATPDVRTAGVFAPTAKGVRADGGYVINGRWAFNTGAANAHWGFFAAMCEDSDGTVAPQLVLIPYSELDYDDNWYPSGLAGTGSRTTIARDVFVPDHRILAVAGLFEGVYPGSSVAATNPYFERKGMAVVASVASGAPVGMARGAMDVFLERLPGRAITYTDYTSQAEAPITHHQVAQATLTLYSAESHLAKASAIMDESIGRELTLIERAGIRGHVGEAAKLSRDVVATLFEASGASAIQSSVHIQRYHRDIDAICLHGLVQPTSSAELYGRVLLGLSPNSPAL